MLLLSKPRKSTPAYLAILILISICLIKDSLGNTISSPRTVAVEVDDVVVRESSDCDDEFPQEFCDLLREGTDSDNCKDSPYRDGCRRTCGLCERPVNTPPPEMIDDDDGLETSTVETDLNKGCEDKIPNCQDYIAMCCSMKDAMNMSCEKTCKFCTETPAPPGSVPGGGEVGQGPAPTGSTSQDPCGSTNPPSVTVDAPSNPGERTTTTTIAPITLPPAAELTTQNVG